MRVSKTVEAKYTSLLKYLDFVAEGKTIFTENWVRASGCKVENFKKLRREEQEISQRLAELMITTLKLIPSTAGLKRDFSTMGFVHAFVIVLVPRKSQNLHFVCVR